MNTLIEHGDVRLFMLGGVPITVQLLAQLVLLALAAIWLSSLAQRWITNGALNRLEHLDLGTRQSIGALVRYVILIVGFALILQNAGINFAALGVVAGAIGVGVGFGLHNIISNFITGLIVMLERPIKTVDRDEVSGVEGVVREIGGRRTTIVTHDNVSILIPNQRFFTDNVVNLVYAQAPIRLRVAIDIAAGADLAEVSRWLLDAARLEPEVLRDPPPVVLVSSLGRPTVHLEVAVWHLADGPVRQQLASQLKLRLGAVLRAHEVKTA